jgi:hypothetical protein
MARKKVYMFIQYINFFPNIFDSWSLEPIGAEPQTDKTSCACQVSFPLKVLFLTYWNVFACLMFSLNHGNEASDNGD